jgi:O-antigen ligase
LKYFRMNYPIIIVLSVTLAGVCYLLLRNPSALIACYIVAVPVIPPVPIGPIEVTVLDLLAVPAVVLIIHRVFAVDRTIRGYFPSGLVIYVLFGAISFISFTMQQRLFSLSIFLRLIRLIEMTLPVILVSQMPKTIKKDHILALFLIGGGLAAAAGIVLFSTGISMRESQTFAAMGEIIFRAAGTHGDSGSFGNLMGLVSLTAIWALIHASFFPARLLNRRLMALTVVSGVLALAGLMLSLSRGGIVLLFIGFAVLLAPLLRRPGKLLRISIIALIVISSGVGLVWIQAQNIPAARVLNALGDRLSSLTGIRSDLGALSSYRTDFWAEAWGIFKSAPEAWPFGLGYKSLRLFYDLPPDNNFFSALFEMGFFGLVSLILMIVLGFKAGFRRLKSNQAGAILILALWVGLTSNMVTADVLTYWHNIPGLFILLTVFADSEEPAIAISGHE